MWWVDARWSLVIAWTVSAVFGSRGVPLRRSDLAVGGHLGVGAAGGGQDEPGSGLGGLVLGGRQDAGVDVGGEHDAGVPELVLRRFEIGAGGVCQAGDAVAQVVQPDRGQAALVGQEAKTLCEVVRVERFPVGAGELHTRRAARCGR